MRGHAPVDDGDCLAVRAVAIGQDRVVHANVLETFYDGQRRAGQDGLDCAGRRDVFCGWCGGLYERGRGDKGLWIEVPDTSVFSEYPVKCYGVRTPTYGIN